MRIILITIATLFVLGVFIVMGRFWGLGQQHALYEHDFFYGVSPLVIVKVETLSEAEETLKVRDDAVLWLDVRLSKEKVAFILPESRDKEFLNKKIQDQEKNPAVPIMIGNKISEYTWDQIKEFYQNPPLLKDFYEKLPQTRFILNVNDNVSEVHQTVINVIEKLNPNKRTLIQSDALLIMTSIKDLKPEWVYGTSIPDIVRLLTFDSLWILPSTQFKGDVFIAPFSIKKRPAFNDEIIFEMRRRKKRVFLGPIQTSADFSEAQRLKADGFITENLTALLDFMSQVPKQ